MKSFFVDHFYFISHLLCLIKQCYFKSLSGERFPSYSCQPSLCLKLTLFQNRFCLMRNARALYRLHAVHFWAHSCYRANRFWKLCRTWLKCYWLPGNASACVIENTSEPGRGLFLSYNLFFCRERPVFSYDREEKPVRRERWEGSAYLVVWRSAFALLISAWGDYSKIYVTHWRCFLES